VLLGGKIMVVNISIRLPWHADGWNGHVCSDPVANVYCGGRHSYPGDMIGKKKNSETEVLFSGKPCSALTTPPPCALSCNAFGSEQMYCMIDPPSWFKSATPKRIEIPPSTVCIWNYEGMYTDEVTDAGKDGHKYDNDGRKANADKYFSKLTAGSSLLVYYANYSNPFSDDESQRYVVVGISRLKEPAGEPLFYDNVSDDEKKYYANGLVWQRTLTSAYPDEGFHVPYEKYMGNPEVLEKILYVPDNARLFKYATREISDDDMVTIVENFIGIVDVLIEIGDTTQNWQLRKTWLIGLFNELWKQRGAYPGFPQVLQYLKQPELAEEYRRESGKGHSVEAYSSIKERLLSEPRVSRTIKLKGKDKADLLLNLLPRFNLTEKQVDSLIDTNGEQNGITSLSTEITANPYILCEQYIGNDPDDIITFYQIDNGALPSSEYGLESLTTADSAERFRALCVAALKWDNTHSFTPSERVLNLVNDRVNKMRDWRQNTFSATNFEVDEVLLSGAITMKKDKKDKLYLYLNEVYEDEQLINEILSGLVDRPEVRLTQPVTAEHFRKSLFKSDSKLSCEEEYLSAIQQQSEVCAEVFRKSLCVISGAAGTGKTTLIKSIIQQIKRTDGEGVSIKLLAPTGKATERIRDKTGYPATTIHSLLASNGWLNNNLSFKRSGGSLEKEVNTIIIDETSMVDLGLFATLFRVIKWSNVKRLILFGDPNQLPPIGRGKVFSDIIVWLNENYPKNLGQLQFNVRQMLNRVTGTGNGIVDLADILIQEKQSGDGVSKARREEILRRIQEGGDVDKDLRVYYWNNIEDLNMLLKKELIRDLKDESGGADLPKSWIQACSIPNSYDKNPSYLQVLSPFRGEIFGTENINMYLQSMLNRQNADRAQIEGIALYDKVIQFINRPKSHPISAYNFASKTYCVVEIFNGDMGFVYPNHLDKSKWRQALQRFVVKFKGKEQLAVNYGRNEYKGRVFNEKPLDNLELAYAISVHKAQGSEFDIVYMVLPKKKSMTLSMELLYTAVTRAQCKLVLFIEDDISTLQSLTKIERSAVRRINSSVFKFEPLPQELSYLPGWYEEYKVIATLEEYFVRSKSEALIANALHSTDMDYSYEKPLFAPDGSMYLPDFTVTFQGEDYYWEHLGLLDKTKYAAKWEKKKQWYERNFAGKLITSIEGNDLSVQIKENCVKYFETYI
jgi:ATP-dependent exoDNAse (exonuclease V) alpha subunit